MHQILEMGGGGDQGLASEDHGGEEFHEGHGGLHHAIPNNEKGRRKSTKKGVVQRCRLGKEREKKEIF